MDKDWCAINEPGPSTAPSVDRPVLRCICRSAEPYYFIGADGSCDPRCKYATAMMPDNKRKLSNTDFQESTEVKCPSCGLPLNRTSLCDLWSCAELRK